MRPKCDRSACLGGDGTRPCAGWRDVQSDRCLGAGGGVRQRSWLRGPDSRAVTRRPARRGPRSVVAVLKFLVTRSEFVFCKCGLRGQRGTHEVPPLLPWDTVSVACTLPPGARLPPSSARSVPASAPCRPLAWGVGAGGPRARVPLPPSAPGGPFAVSV